VTRPSSAVARALAADLACVAVFVLVGRRSHHDDAGLAGFGRVVWPFAAAAVVATVIAVAIRLRPWGAALLVWLGTVAGGMALRIGVQGREWKPGFVIVTTLFLALTMLGWRLVAWVLVPWVRTRAR